MANRNKVTKFELMKKIRNYTKGFILLAMAISFMACEENNFKPESNESILPENFKVDIPNSISNNNARFKSTEGDTLNGNEIYENLTNFIAIGEGSADIVEAIIWHLRIFDIYDVIDLTYVSDEDGRVKHMEIVEGGEYTNQTWEYTLTVTDVESAVNADGGVALKLYWNTSPVAGVALLKPYNINRADDDGLGDAMYSIEYSEAGMGEYDAYMIVQIANIPLPNAELEPYAANNIKMFVGKKGDIIDVYGNSNHPNATFFTEETGFNWAFIASGDENKDISVAEVSLPPTTLDTPSRDIILKDYSIKNVLTDEINTWFLDNLGIRPNDEDLANYLMNADAPGFFNQSGFIQGGTAPSDEYNELVDRLTHLSPYNPAEINALSIEF